MTETKTGEVASKKTYEELERENQQLRRTVRRIEGLLSELRKMLTVAPVKSKA